METPRKKSPDGLEESRKNKIEELRKAIAIAEDRDDDEEVEILEAELRSIEEGKDFDRDAFLLKNIRLKNRHRPSVLKDMLNLANESPDHVWSWDGVSSSGPSYEETFSDILKKFKISSFQELVNKRSNELNRHVKVLDLFGGAYFLRDLNKVSRIIGVRLQNMDSSLLIQARNSSNKNIIKDMKRLIKEPKRKVIEGDLYKGETWREIRNDNEKQDKKGFDLIICRPGGPFGRRAGGGISTIKNIEDGGVVREEFFVSLLNRALDLLSDDDGVLFTETPFLNTPKNIETMFWKNYTEEMKKKGFEFIFDKNTGVYSDTELAVIRHKIS